MAAVHGRNTVVIMDDIGGTPRTLTGQVRQSSLQIAAQEIEVTAYGDGAKRYIGDYADGTFNFEGNANATVMGYLYAVAQAGNPVSFEYGPEGNATGKRKYTFEGVLTNVQENGASVGQANQFQATVRVDGPVTPGTYA